MKFPFSSASFRPLCRFRLRHLLLVVMLPLVCMGAHARPPMFDGFLAGERDRAERPAGLRESLAPRNDREESAPTRRKLSTEERSALRRDLRDAMRGAYPEDPRPPRRRN